MMMRHEARLCEIARKWLARNALPQQSMDEVLHELWERQRAVAEDHQYPCSRYLKLDEQIAWARRFIEVWERLMDMEQREMQRD